MKYANTYQFEPLLPQKKLEELYAVAQAITEAALSLRKELHPTTANHLLSY